MKKAFTVLLTLISLQAISSEVIIAADTWCPYNCQPGSKLPGAMIEIAQLVFKEHDIKVKYKVLPWVRAIKYAEKGKIQGIVGAIPSESPTFLFPSNGQAGMSNGIFCREETKWKNIRKQLIPKKVRIGIINGYSYNDEFDTLIKEGDKRFQKVFGSLPMEQLLRQLKRNRIDCILDDKNVFNYNKKKHAPLIKTKQVKTLLGTDKELFIAFSPLFSKSKLLVKILSEGTEKLRKNGKLKIILKKYGLKDWKDWKD